MTKPEHTRPFNLEHAKAGAPIEDRNGEIMRFFSHAEAAHPSCRVIVISPRARIETRRESGRVNEFDQVDNPHDLVMTPLGMIDGKPVFVGDALNDKEVGTYFAQPTERDFSDCTWPAPARQYPVTGMSRADVTEVYRNGPAYEGTCLLAVANAAIAHAIDADTVRITEEVKAREMAISKAVLETVYQIGLNAVDEATLRNIIASVKD